MTVLTANLVDVLQGQTEGLVSGAGRWQDGIQSLQQGGSRGIAVLALDLPSLEPAHLQTKVIDCLVHVQSD